MAIERMQRATFLTPKKDSEALVSLLQQTEFVHVEDITDKIDSEEMPLKRNSLPTEEADHKLARISFIEDLLQRFSPAKRGLVGSIVQVPMVVDEDEVKKLRDEFPLDEMFEQCRELAHEHAENEKSIQAAQAEIEDLMFYIRLPFDLADLNNLKMVKPWMGEVSVKAWQQLRADEWIADKLAVQEVYRQKRTVHLCVIAMPDDAEEAAARLRKYGFAERAIPSLDVSAEERVEKLKTDIERMDIDKDNIAETVVELAEKRREVLILKGFWNAELERLRAASSGASASRIALYRGYVKESSAEDLRRTLEERLPGTSLVLEAPSTGENVPVSLSASTLMRPMRFMVRMFGLPDYFSFDPTPYLALSFLIFFGFCFGDVFYGLALCLLAGYLAKKAKPYEGLYDFCMMFFYCGVITFIIGLLTGAWASDLPAYFGEDNAWLRFTERLAVVDSLEKPILMLLVALGLGAVNQFYGIILKGYQCAIKGDYFGMVFDAGAWLIMLPGFMISVSTLFFPVPGWLLNIGLGMMAVSGIALILTQGRHEDSIIGKAMTGVISIYGILGSYGCVSFFGDLLSYSRLLALGLTTFIVGMSFNVMAEILRDIPMAGVVLFALVLIIGHAFNFAVSILGAFVHPARLIFLEFFGRFYEGGAPPFRPLSRSNDEVMVVPSRTQGS